MTAEITFDHSARREASVFWPGRVGVRVEDIILCTEEGGMKLNEHPTDLVANG